MDKDIENILKFNNDISILKIEEFLEYLENENCLTEKGIKLRNSIWRKFIFSDDINKTSKENK